MLAAVRIRAGGQTCGCEHDTQPMDGGGRGRVQRHVDQLVAEGEASSSPAGSRGDSMVVALIPNPTPASGGGE